mmetsp:Transcript_51419/g.166741  ORF Transcript_51419/g.166741 Transcript_51419/m.166741 type:complete len:576 (+) Transcript_51419:23-1750(+)
MLGNAIDLHDEAPAQKSACVDRATSSPGRPSARGGHLDGRHLGAAPANTAAATAGTAALAVETHAADADAIGANVGGLGEASADDRGAVHGIHPTGEIQVRIDGQLASHSTSHPVGGSTAQRRRRRQGEARAALPHAAQRLRDAGGEGGAGQGEEDRHRMRRSVRSACDFHQVRPRRAPAAAEPAGQVAAALAGRRPDLEAADALPGQHQSVVLHPRRRPSCLGTAPSAATWRRRCGAAHAGGHRRPRRGRGLRQAGLLGEVAGQAVGGAVRAERTCHGPTRRGGGRGTARRPRRRQASRGRGAGGGGGLRREDDSEVEVVDLDRRSSERGRCHTCWAACTGEALPTCSDRGGVRQRRLLRRRRQGREGRVGVRDAERPPAETSLVRIRSAIRTKGPRQAGRERSRAGHVHGARVDDLPGHRAARSRRAGGEGGEPAEERLQAEATRRQDPGSRRRLREVQDLRHPRDAPRGTGAELAAEVRPVLEVVGGGGARRGPRGVDGDTVQAQALAVDGPDDAHFLHLVPLLPDRAQAGPAGHERAQGALAPEVAVRVLQLALNLGKDTLGRRNTLPGPF